MSRSSWLARRAVYHPFRPALVDLGSGRVTTYRDLASGAAQAASRLATRYGVRPGDRVAVLAGNRRETVELLFACGDLGAVLVPLNHRLAPPEIAGILTDCAPRVLFHGADCAATVGALAVLGCLPDVTVGLDGPTAPAEERPGGGEGVEAPGGAALDGGTPWMLLYTSGTTGRPKGAVLTHGSVLWNAVNTEVAWELDHRDVTLCHTPLFHTGGWNVLTLPLLHVGGTVVLADRFDPRAVLDAIPRHGVTILFAVPTMFRMMLDAAGDTALDLGRLRCFVSGGAPCPGPLADAWTRRGVLFKQGYGLTEVGPNCFHLPDERVAGKPGSVGLPVPHLEVRLVDDGGADVPDGTVGELWLRGPTVCGGYFRNSEATAAATRPGGWFATGDLLVRDGDGFHTVVGRKKEMFISGGENVYPIEIEQVLLSAPGVGEAAVVPIPDEKWGEVGVAFVSGEARPGATAPSAASLLALCRERLARYKVPRRALVLDTLPKGPTGKIDKRALAALAREGLA